MFLDYTNHFWPQLTAFYPLNWHFKIFCNFKGYKFANFKEVQRPSYKSYWPNFFLTMSKKVQFAKKNRKKKKNTFLMDTRPKTAKWLRPKKIKHYPLRFFIKIDIVYIWPQQWFMQIFPLLSGLWPILWPFFDFGGQNGRKIKISPNLPHYSAIDSIEV